MHNRTIDMLIAIRDHSKRPGDGRLTTPAPLEIAAWIEAGCPDAPAPKWSAIMASGHTRIIRAPDLLTATQRAVEVCGDDLVGVSKVKG
jgi:hypothetical protein